MGSENSKPEEPGKNDEEDFGLKIISFLFDSIKPNPNDPPMIAPWFGGGGGGCGSGGHTM